MRVAIEYLATALQCVTTACGTHSTSIIAGWEDDDCAREAIAKYLVGLRACAIDAALHIKAELEDTQADRDEILQNVMQIVSRELDPADANTRDNWISTERNPWIAEAIWHLAMAVAASRADLHPPGRILLLDYAHIKAKDHGLDIAAIFEDGDSVGFTIIETKAYKDDPNGAIGNAVTFFREVRENQHDIRIRHAVQLMRNALSATENSRISGSFWKRNRVYICNPHYRSDVSINWGNRRPSLQELSSTNERVFVMPSALAHFEEFFDDIAERMQCFAEELQQCTTNTPVA